MSGLKIFKFGGASVKNAEAVKNVGAVLGRFKGDKLLVVVSAMGKTTNSLENLVAAYFKGDLQEQRQYFSEIKSYHDEIVSGLLKGKDDHAFDDIENTFIELECLLGGKPEGDFDFVYDQIVSFGEIISTKIVSAYLNESGFRNRWMDARNFILTDSTYREGRIDWNSTTSVIKSKLGPLVNKQVIITQGFIGRTPNNNTTTLGREGSDYSAAIFAYGLDAQSVTIWKDVAGVLNADPKRFKDTVKLDKLTYNEAIELAYYGATVIHPKTIQPLKSKNIPLYVKSFLNPDADGTLVSNTEHQLVSIPIVIVKANQALISISSRDFSFIIEDNLSNIFSSLAECHIRVNLMQNSAISFSLCMDADQNKMNRLVELLKVEYNVKLNVGCELFTIRNFNDKVLLDYVAGKEVLLEQKTRSSVQLVISA